MKKSVRTWMLATASEAVGLALVASLSPSACAQSADAHTQIPPQGATAPQPGGQQGHLEEIIVTAQKREQRVNTVPMSIIAVTGEQLQQAGIKDVSDLGKITPGLTYVQSPTGAPVYTLRGIGYNDSSLATRPAVTVYVDESPMPFAVETRGAGLDAERVEVLKGPQGTLFGSNSTGGAINYIAGKPTKALEAGATFTYGRFDEADISGFVSGPITDTLGARLAIEHQGSGGWQQSVTRPGDTAGKTDFTNGRLSLQWEPTDDLRVLVTANRWVDRSDFVSPQAIAIVPRVPALAAAAGVANYPAMERDDQAADWAPGANLTKNNRFFSMSGRADYDLNDAITLTSLTSYNDFQYFVPAQASGVNIPSNDNYNFTGRSNTVSQELRLAAKFDQLNFIVGGNYDHDTPSEHDVDFIGSSTPIRGLSAAYGNGTPVTSVANEAQQSDDSYAGFANAEYELAPELTIMGGVRYTQTNIDYTGCTADAGDGTAANAYRNLINKTRAARHLAPIPPIQPGGCITADSLTLLPGAVVSKLDENNVSWRAGVQYKPFDSTMLYVTVSKGYKAGGYPFTVATFSPSLHSAQQESVLTYEGGFKSSLLDQTAQLNGAFFYNDYKNKQLVGVLVDPVVGAIGALLNVPQARVYGAELEITAAPYPGLTVNAAASWIRSDILGHYTAPNNLSKVQDFNGTDLPNVPHWQLHATARYQWALNARLDMFTSASLTYQSASNSELGNLQPFVNNSYTLVDLSAGVQGPAEGGNWSAYLWGRNVFNKTYLQNNLILLDTHVHYMGLPATFGVTLAYKY